MDVSSLYTNIDNTEGLNTLKESLQENRDRNERPTINALVQMMTMVLLLNNFVFDQKHYLQKKGTAMGTRGAPNYANIFMGDFENDTFTTPFSTNLYTFIKDL